MRKLYWLLALGLIVMSFMPLWVDPYDHTVCVNFWGWLYRETHEAINGEKT